LECGGLPLLSCAKLASREQGGSKLPHSKANPDYVCLVLNNPAEK
jgi:hypothetical protein